LAIYLMEKDLEILKKEYEKAILNAYKVSKGQNYMMFILSARDFNQGYKRIKYLQEVNQYRRNIADQILELKKEIEKIENKLNEDMIVVSNLKSNQEKQKNALLNEQEKKQVMINSLSSKERQLKKELDNKKKIAQRIENEIARIIDEERRKNIEGALTPEMKLISDNFASNKGRLPWPVEKGVITGNFGLQKHKELAFVTENNPGIEITSLGKVKVRSVFKGEVVRVLPISGANMSIIIKHGNYFTVYQNLVNVIVKTGDIVETKQILGEVYCDEGKDNKSILKFMIFKEKEKLNPEEWIAKSQ
ncbi:MAG TPA: peptidoglycan DD-metalloendopeptidase family protein, partial [Bacteroidales bacterium]|nr:peptidoglycan DD-metalloendopeptidase family protein [Bacteroidales bacterium]